MFEFAEFVNLATRVVHEAEKNPEIHADLAYIVADFRAKFEGIIAHHAAGPTVSIESDQAE